jgi:TolB-like protein
MAPRTVFLSYARADQKQAARLAKTLEAAGLDVWWDAMIDGGAVFAKSIEAQLTRCDAVIVCWSRTSVESDWVRDEAAKGRDLRKLVPVSFDGTAPPLGFGQYHSIDLSRWRGAADAAEIAGLVRAIALVTKDTQAPLRPATKGRQSTYLSRRALLASTAGIAVAGAAGVVFWRRGLDTGSPKPSGNSVAVLPFENLSGDPDQAYFSDGLSEEVRATLARNALLLVMAETSSGKFRDRGVDAKTIAATLGVAFLLDGSVRRAGNVVRVAADLIDGTTGFSRWSRTFDRSLHDIFAVQSEIADAVASALAAQMTKAAPDSATHQDFTSSGGTASVAAYDDYLRGRALYDLSSDEAAERDALARFDAAIAADPGYAAAHAARARSLTAIANQYGEVGQLDELYSAAIGSARRAIELAAKFADAHSTLGNVLFQGRLDARTAREPFEKSRLLGAGDANVLARYSLYSARIGRKREAADAMRRALVLDPLNPLIHRAAGAILYAARNYAESIPPAEHALAMNPKMSRAHAAIGDALLMSGRSTEARAAYGLEPAQDVGLTGQAIVEWRLGNHESARAAMKKLVDELGDRALYQQAQVLAQWAEKESALAKLERARLLGDSGLIYARNDPLLDGLRKEPRFARLLSSVGFDPVT